MYLTPPVETARGWDVVESCTNTSVLRLYLLVQTPLGHFRVCSEGRDRVGVAEARGVSGWGSFFGGVGVCGLVWGWFLSFHSSGRPGLSSQTRPCGGQQQFLRMIPGGK